MYLFIIFPSVITKIVKHFSINTLYPAREASHYLAVIFQSSLYVQHVGVCIYFYDPTAQMSCQFVLFSESKTV